MSVNSTSRHYLCVGVTRIDDGLTFLLDRDPIRFQPSKDNKRVVAREGDTWQSLASEHFTGINNGEELFWAICDYQPVPVLDSTVDPVAGTTVYIPSEDFLLANYFSESRRDISDI